MINKMVQIKTQLLTFQKDILNDIKPFVVENSSFLDAHKWYYTSPNIYLYNQKDKLYISSENARNEYASFLEKNNSYSYLPKNEMLVLPNEELEVYVKGQVLGDIQVTLMLIEYSKKEKLKVHTIPLNTKVTITTNSLSRQFRIGIKVSRTGICNIEGVEFKRKNDIQFSLKDSTQIQEVVKKKSINQLDDLKVACIFDEFTRTCYEKEVNLITFTQEDWKTVLSQDIPDILMVESAWKGNFGAWEFQIASYNNQKQSSLFELIKWCKERNIPTIFWNKEDPIHFEKFIKTAKHFDYIFTTDENMIGNYIKQAGHKNVFALPFSAEPKLHNPIKIQETRENKICFAGSYYANRHEDRKKDMDEVLDICADFGLDIYDRNYERNQQGIQGFSFPARFKDNIIGSLKYDEIDKAYKGYKVMLNVNSVKHSPTMFSRRIFEGLACGTPIISTYSEGISKMFKDIVLVSENKEVLNENLERLMKSERFYREKSLEGIREVFLNHTYKHRMKFILDKVGIEYQLKNPKVTVLGIANSEEDFYKLLQQYNSQTWPQKELVVFINTFEGYQEILNNYNTQEIKSYMLTYLDHYSRLSDLIKTEFISYFSVDNFYGENYLLDLMIASIYSDADIIGKSISYTQTKSKNKVNEKKQFNEYEYVSNLNIESSVIKLNVFHGEALADTINSFINKKSLNRYFKKGFRLFASDKFNYLKLGQKASIHERNKLEL